MRAMRSAAPPPASESRWMRLLDSERFLATGMLAPAVIYIVLLIGVPFLFAILLSFSDSTVGNPGIDKLTLNTFRNVLNNPNFRRALGNTLMFTVTSQIIVIMLANILAAALSVNFRGKWLIRFFILLPWATPIAISAIGWLWIFEPTYSPIDWIFRQIGLLGSDGLLQHLGLLDGGLIKNEANMYWFGGGRWPARMAVVVMYVWRILPMSTVIIMAGLTSIPSDVKDAVAVDGVSWWTEYWEVTLPLLRPILLVASLFTIIFSFTDMTIIYIVTRGNPANFTQVLANQAFYVGIEGGNLAEGAATAIFMLPVLMGVAMIMLRVARRSEVT